MAPAPIVLFIYNRPEHTARTLASLAANPLARESDLIVYADGPKKAEHERSVQTARMIAREAKGFRSVRLIERARNLGLAMSITAGVTEVCEQHGRAIVVEDDLVVAPSFLKFLNEGLDRYEDEERVFQISGYMFPIDSGASSDSLFLPLISCWGWATWRNAWRKFDANATGYAALECDANLRDRFNLGGAYDYFGMLQSQVDGGIDSWGVLWLLSVFMQKGLVLYPRRSLVENAGVDGSGSHGLGVASLQKPLGWHDGGAWTPPAAVAVDNHALEQVSALLGSAKPGRVRQLVRKIFR